MKGTHGLLLQNQVHYVNSDLIPPAIDTGDKLLKQRIAPQRLAWKGASGRSRAGENCAFRHYPATIKEWECF
jgi:hypothetical protein